MAFVQVFGGGNMWYNANEDLIYYFEKDDINFKNPIEIKSLLTKKIKQLNTDLTDIITASQIGAGTKNFTIANTRKRFLIVAKKSNMIVESKEIPTIVLNSGDVISLGNTAPIISGNMGTPPTVAPTQATKEIKVGVTFTNQTAGHGQKGFLYDTKTGTIGPDGTINTSAGLFADLSEVEGATITYNGNNSFTITVTDSSLSVYVY